MNKDELLQQLTAIFRDVFDNDGIVISAASTAKDIEEWDSLTHIQLVVTIEKHFKIKFTAAEIISFKTVGDMCDKILQKL